MFNYKEEWVKAAVSFDGVEISSWGRLRYKGNLINPIFRKGFGWTYCLAQDRDICFIPIRALILRHFPFVSLEINKNWANQVRAQNAKEQAPDPEDLPPTRRCHDCGKPTNNYRCEECWQKIRAKRKGSYCKDPDIAHF